MGLFWQTNSYFRQKSSFLWNVYWKIWLKDSMNHLVYATGKFLPNIGRIIAGSVIWTVNLKLLLMYQKKELSYLQIPEMKQFSSNLPDSRYIFHGSVTTYSLNIIILTLCCKNWKSLKNIVPEINTYILLPLHRNKYGLSIWRG